MSSILDVLQVRWNDNSASLVEDGREDGEKSSQNQQSAPRKIIYLTGSLLIKFHSVKIHTYFNQ